MHYLSLFIRAFFMPFFIAAGRAMNQWEARRSEAVRFDQFCGALRSHHQIQYLQEILLNCSGSILLGIELNNHSTAIEWLKRYPNKHESMEPDKLNYIAVFYAKKYLWLPNQIVFYWNHCMHFQVGIKYCIVFDTAALVIVFFKNIYSNSSIQITVRLTGWHVLQLYKFTCSEKSVMIYCKLLVKV